MRTRLSIAGTLGGLFLTSMAAAQEPAATAAKPTFGTEHSVVISSDAQLSFQYATTSTVPLGSGAAGTLTEGGDSVTVLEIAPALDWFVIENLSIGGQLAFVYETISTTVTNGTMTTSSSESITAFGIGPRVGYNIPFSDLVSLWPRLGPSYFTASASNNGGSSSSFELGVQVPLLFHVAPHFFLGFGPDFSTQLTNSQSNNGVSADRPKQTRIGAQLTVGGWL